MRPKSWILLVLAALATLVVVLCLREQPSDLSSPAPVRATESTGGTPTLVGRVPEAPPGIAPVAPAPSVALEVEGGLGGSVEGLVTGWDGQPARGLQVSLVAVDAPVPPRRKSRQWYVNDAPLVPRAITDATGRYLLTGMPRQGEFVVVVRVGPNYEVRSAPLRYAEERQRCDVAVPPPATLRVRLVGSADPPGKIHQLDVTSEFVWFSTDPGEEIATWPDPTILNLGGGWDSKVEEEGQAVSIRLGSGPIEIGVWIEGGPRVAGNAVLVSGTETIVELAVPTEGAVNGQLVFPEGRHAVHAEITWEGDDDLYTAEADAKGRFQFRGVGRGKGKLEAEAHMADGSSLTVTLRDVLPDGSLLLVHLKEPARVAATLDLPPGVEARGMLLSRDVSAIFSEKRDQQGRFEIEVTTEEPCLLVLPLGGMAPILMDLEGLAPGELRKLGVLRHSPGVELVGEVRNQAGEPVAEVEVAVAERWAAETRLPPVTTDARGSFRIPHMPLRPLLLRFRGGGFPQHVKPVDPSHAPTVEMVLTPGGLARVRVVDREGREVRGAWLTVHPVGEFRYDEDFDTLGRGVKLAAEGESKIQMCAGPRRLQAWSKPEGRSEPVEVTIREGETLDVTLVVGSPTPR